jgi:hypothetical protein
MIGYVAPLQQLTNYALMAINARKYLFIKEVVENLQT